VGAVSIELISESPERTHALGVALGERLEPGHFVGLIGELGAGKTSFTRGVAAGAGVPASQVSSPSFAIVYPYRGRLPVYHADLYRLADEDELYATGYFDLIGGDGAVLVEWLDHVPAAAPPERLVVTLEHVDETRRRLRIEAFGERHERLRDEWLRAGFAPL
jgi:tRNA threonylcarbamoyladenosine biosynthesis protein TsaE